MNSTEKLYWSDAHATSFETRGASLGTHAGKPSLVLPQTMFYPEGGGQLGDLGTLTLGAHVVRIADTQVEDGAIHHVIDGALEPALAELLAGAAAAELTVRGAVDEVRRRDNMVQHTAQHALSRALANAARADTVSARLGAASCTIDVSRPGLSDADLHRAEDLVNAVVMSDVPVVTSFPSAEDLAKLDLRKQPNAEKSAAGVRIVSIEGFDLTPCGGTHCTRTGQIGQIRVVATEKYKGMLRITFHAGQRALADARSRHDVLAALAADLTCGAQDIPTAVAKLRGEAKGLREKLDAARTELAELVARGLRDALPASPGPHVVTIARPLDDLAGLRALAVELTKDARVVALVSGGASADESSGEVVLVVQRGADAKLDCGAFVQAQAKARGGRGGGRPERAEGRFPRGTSLEELAAAATGALGA
ncbi:MAG: alanyl-tRNA synthetase [Myxococcales bacterium]|nr:alanyl-tRNA synthetase [Myxococcales bacterium]